MKQVVRLSSDNVDLQDNRFNFKVIKSDDFTQAPNSLPLFWKQENRYIPCTHFKLDRELDDVFDALVYHENISYEEALKDLISSDTLNIFDCSLILNLLDTFSPKCNKLEWALSLELPVKEWEKIKSLDDIPLQWKTYFISKNTPLKRIFYFIEPDLRDNISPLLSLNPGINILEQIAILMKEIALREHSSYDKIIQEFQLASIISQDDIKSSIKLNNIRHLLFAKRYPTISEFREKLRLKNNEFDKLKNLHINSDENFETPGIELKYLMTNIKDIDSLQGWINSNKKVIQDILDLQKG